MEQNNHLSNFVFPGVVSVTGQYIDISALSKAQQEFYIHLFIKTIGLYDPIKSRMIVGLAGPTGSGKSVIASIFTELARQLNLPFRFQTVGMDAFHFPNSYLESHVAIDGKILKQVKGRHDTYDVESLLSTMQQFRSGHTVSFPEYSRTLHNPVKDVHNIVEEKVLLLLEGLWLYYDGIGWDKLLPLFNHKIFIDADKELVKEMVVRRHERGGRSIEAAIEHYNKVDAVNFDEVMQTRYRADEIISAYYAAEI